MIRGFACPRVSYSAAASGRKQHPNSMPQHTPHDLQSLQCCVCVGLVLKPLTHIHINWQERQHGGCQDWPL